ncbi:MAG: class I SAM-dependent methyltransferase [Verrucomicrobiae bacterium]|nr:class I SAM-dependent methyltransferase [Verrucomicrobiae bacterium]
MSSQPETLRQLRAFAAEIPALYPAPAADYRGRVIDASTVRAYLNHEAARFAEIAAFLPPPPHPKARLLDIGTAYGFLPVLLNQTTAWQCEGLEMEENIPVYCRFAQARKLAIHAGRLGPAPLPFPDNAFDAILFSEVLEHLRLSPALVLRELRRILAPGGFLLLTTPNVARLANLIKLLLQRNILEEFPENIESENITEHLTHIREYTMGEVCSLLQKHGFRIAAKRFSLCMEKEKPHAPIAALVPPWRGNLFVLAQKPAES